MTRPDSNDINAIGGAHPGTKTQEELANELQYVNKNAMLADQYAQEQVKDDRSLGKLASDIVSKAEWHFSTFSDSNSSTKYAASPSNSYLAGGTLSCTPEGKFTVSDNSNENTRGALTVDKPKSTIYSDAKSTTLGSLDIDTADGYELNQLSTTFPSTNFSPTKPWLKKIFPHLYDRNFIYIMTAEILVTALFVLLDKQGVGKSLKSSENTTRKQNDASQNDMAVIIKDNQEIENQLFERTNQQS